MGFFDIFINKNQDKLSFDEKEAAEILKDILIGYQNGDPDYLPNGVEGLSLSLYYLSFKRTSKKVVRPGEFVDIDAIFSGNSKGLEYASVYEGIKKTIQNACTNTVQLKSIITLPDCEKAILLLLKATATRISQM